MSNLIEQILKMETGRIGDCILLQKKRPGSNGEPDYNGAYAIIRQIATHGGIQWAFHSMRMGRTGSGHYGDINSIVKMAESQFGTKSDVREWIYVNYFDEGFPANLIAG